MKKSMFTIGLGALALAAMTAAPAMAAGDAAAGHTVFTAQKCNTCHGEGGKGDGAAAKALKLDLVDWTSKDAMAKMSDDEIKAIIQKGGKAVGKSPKMPAYGSKLSDTDVDNLVAYIRSLAK
jgi:mono/diheme cytochrome c family protein